MKRSKGAGGSACVSSRCARQESHSTLHKIGRKKIKKDVATSSSSSVAEVQHVSSQRPLHRKQADEKRLRRLHRASVMQLSVDIKAPLHLKNATASLC